LPVADEPITADEICQILQLKPLPIEGGMFRQSYRSLETMSDGRPAGTGIYALFTDEPDSFSAMHRLDADELWHFYLGDPLEIVMLNRDGSHNATTLGHDIRAGHVAQLVVPQQTWVGARLASGGCYALIGCTMSPGFQSGGYEGGEQRALCDLYPAAASWIVALTRPGSELGQPPEA
jgi:uncharacterized protein